MLLLGIGNKAVGGRGNRNQSTIWLDGFAGQEPCCFAEENTRRVWLVPYPRELCDSGHATRGPARHLGDNRNGSQLAKVGCQRMPKAAEVEVMTPGKNQRRYLAGALDLLDRLDRAYPVWRFDCIYGMADNCQIHKAATV